MREQQIELVSNMRYPHILLGYGVCRGSVTELWLVMEFADGGDFFNARVPPDFSETNYVCIFT